MVDVTSLEGLKLEQMADELRDLRRWKSTHAPRIEALEALLRTAQLDAAAGREAVATLASERAANARLTDELERLRAVADQVLRDMQAQDVLMEWQTLLREALWPNVRIDAGP